MSRSHRKKIREVGYFGESEKATGFLNLNPGEQKNKGGRRQRYGKEGKGGYAISREVGIGR